MQARRPLVILVGSTAPANAVGAAGAAPPPADDDAQSLLARRFAEVLAVQRRVDRERDRKRADGEDDEKSRAAVEAAAAAAASAAAANEARAQAAASPQPDEPRPDEPRPEARAGEQHPGDPGRAAERAAEAVIARREPAPAATAAPRHAEAGSAPPAPATGSTHDGPGLRAARPGEAAGSRELVPSLPVPAEPLETASTRARDEPAGPPEAIGDAPTVPAGPMALPLAPMQQAPQTQGGDAGSDDAQGDEPDDWTRAMVGVLASLHHRASPTAEGWTVTLPADPVVLPDSCLRIEVSPHWMSLRFATHSPESHRLLSTHAQDLVRSLQKELGDRRQIDLEIA
ncbi:MAG TPA: type III secretion HpaP family protein [Methylibium sp.]|uniref:type III secretion HpaP family protein n=1 Tax=Methylibium sp. TaxID=2067992 RepID=UPI002DBC2C9B|nr:type III secretion HpaP family protein [Methylibium sp.]HEU4459592.1 type III secretion HpaP family protein [Methylibium sp.]